MVAALGHKHRCHTDTDDRRCLFFPDCRTNHCGTQPNQHDRDFEGARSQQQKHPPHFHIIGTKTDTQIHDLG